MYLNKRQIELVRTKMAGYVGGIFIAQWASDMQISQIVELKDKKARLFNEAADIKAQIESIQNTIRECR